MRIKEVCALTGLTERTIRYYEEEGLISPKTTKSNGRVYRNYSTADAGMLQTIAKLRQAELSIEEIRQMQKQPKKIASIMDAYAERLSAEIDEKSKLFAVVQALDFSAVSSLEMLAAKLSDGTTGRALPKSDLEPNFGRFDPESREDKEREYEAYQQRQEMRYQTGKIIVWAVAGGNMLLAILNLILNFDASAIFTVVIQLILSICLVMGVSWIRWVFVSGSASSALLAGYMLVLWFIEANGAGGILMPIFFSIMLLFSLASAVLLAVNKGVSEYLYGQRQGW